MDKMFHHHGHGEHKEGTADTAQSQDQQQAAPKESEGQKFKDYIKKDEQMEQEGKEYGGLM